jgi:hypothetical protein
VKVYFLLFLSSFLPYVNTLKHNFVWDDNSLITTNQWIKSLSNIDKFFTDYSTASDDRTNKIYRPITTLSYALDYQLWGLNPYGYHLNNVVLHFFVSISLFLFIKNVFGNNFIAVLTSLLFGVHPVHTEAISWVKGRADILMTLFFVLSLLFYHISNTKKKKFYYFLSLILFIISIFSKETSVVLPLIILVFDFVVYNKINIKKYVPYLIIAICFVLIRRIVMGSFAQCGWWGGSPYYTFLTMLFVLPIYFRLLFFPFNLCADYIFDIKKTFFSTEILFSALFVLFLVLITIFSLKTKNYIIFFCLTFIIISLLPVLNIIPIEVLLAERFLYLPSIGFCLFMGYYLEKLFITEQTFAYTVFAIISVLFFITTYLRNFDWKDNFSLWNKTFLQNTKNFRAANNLAFEYEKIGDYEKALNLYSYALTLPAYISPKSAPQQLYARVHNNIGNIYFNTKNYTKAIEEYSIAIKMDPEYSQAYFNLGLLYKTIGDLNKAIYYYQKAIELSPKTAEYYNNLGIVYMLKDNYDEAIKMYTKALEINPYFTQVYSNLEIALRYKQKIKQ